MKATTFCFIAVILTLASGCASKADVEAAAMKAIKSDHPRQEITDLQCKQEDFLGPEWECRGVVGGHAIEYDCESGIFGVGCDEDD